MPKLIVHATPSETMELDLAGRPAITIGRADGNDIVLGWRMASRRHASIELRDGQYWLLDHDSFNGTYLNDRPVTESQLQSGDQVRIAGCSLQYVDARETTEHGFADVPTEPDLPLSEFALPGDVTQSTGATAMDESPPGFGDDDPTVPLTVSALGGPATATGDVAPAGLGRTESTAAQGPVPRGAGAGGDRSSAPTTAAPTTAAPTTAAPTTAATPVTPPRRSALGWPAVFALGAGIVLLSVLYSARTRPAEPTSMTPPPTADHRALEAALAGPPEDRIGLLWGFITDHPASPERPRAYRALIDAGATRDLVCRHAHSHAQDLMKSDAALAAVCAQP